MHQEKASAQENVLTDSDMSHVKRVDSMSAIDLGMTQRDGLRRQRARNNRQQVLKIGTVISVLALLIAWLGQEELPPVPEQQQIVIALPAKEAVGFDALPKSATKPTAPEGAVSVPAPVLPAVTTIPVASGGHTAVQAVPAMSPSAVVAPQQVTSIANKDILRINDQAIGLVHEGSPRQAIGLLEKTLLEHKDAGPLFENLRRLYAGFATQSYQLALEPGKAKPVTVELLSAGGESVSVQLASLDMKARSATQALPATTNLPELPAKPVLSSVSANVAPASPEGSAELSVARAEAVAVEAIKSKETSKETSKEESKGPTSAEKVEATRAVMAAVKRWADAWSKKDPDTYIAMYAPQFKPKDMTRAQWEAYRRDRLTKPKEIRVELSDQKAVMLTPTHMRVTFNQMYASDALKANDKKTLELELIDNQWRITSESGR